MDATRAAEGDPAAFAASIDRLRASLESPRMRLLRPFNGLDAGLKFLVDMRAHLRRMIQAPPEFTPLASALRDLPLNWFHTRYPASRRRPDERRAGNDRV